MMQSNREAIVISELRLGPMFLGASSSVNAPMAWQHDAELCGARRNKRSQRAAARVRQTRPPTAVRLNRL